MKILLKTKACGSAIGRHPWIFKQQIAAAEGHPPDGAEVPVYREDGRFIGRGFYNSESAIRVRLLRWENESDKADDPDFIRRKITQAIALRKDLNLLHRQGACRLIFSEGDGLPGLTVDRFGNYLSVQITSLAFYHRKTLLLETLQELMEPDGIWLQAGGEHAEKEGFKEEGGEVFGNIPEEPIPFVENSLHYAADLRQGQKTGFFLDQRENRKALAQWAKDRDCLDLCCYSGGFSLSLALAGAKTVKGIDSSERAISLAKEVAKQNSAPASLEFQTSDAFDWLKSDPQQYDLIVLDPPRLAPSQKHKAAALKKYFSFNEAALSKLKEGGMFATFTCSSAISRDDLMSVAASASRRLGRGLQVIGFFNQSPDHVISAHCPETEYLKGLLCRSYR